MKYGFASRRASLFSTFDWSALKNANISTTVTAISINGEKLQLVAERTLDITMHLRYARNLISGLLFSKRMLIVTVVKALFLLHNFTNSLLNNRNRNQTVTSKK